MTMYPGRRSVSIVLVMSLDVMAAARCSLPLQIGKLDQEPGGNDWRYEGDRGGGDELVMPENVERNQAGAPVGQELQGVDLVVAMFFLQGHALVASLSDSGSLRASRAMSQSGLTSKAF